MMHEMPLDGPRICSIDECDKKYEARGLCKMHYTRVLRHGSLADLPARSENEILADRLASRLRRTEGGCLEWTGAVNKHGYGRIRAYGGKKVTTSRLAWELVNGPIAAGLEVCHRCDNPPCNNVAHLFLGTHAENMADMKAKGRSRNRRLAQFPAVPTPTEQEAGQ